MRRSISPDQTKQRFYFEIRQDRIEKSDTTSITNVVDFLKKRYDIPEGDVYFFLSYIQDQFITDKLTLRIEFPHTPVLSPKVLKSPNKVSEGVVNGKL